MKQKIVAIMLAMSVVVGGMPVMGVQAEEKSKESLRQMQVEESDTEVEIIDSGRCGEDATYTLDSEGTLIISGTGEIESDNDFYVDEYYVYESLFKNKMVKKVIIEDGITSIGQSAFRNCISIISIEIPQSVTFMGDYVFDGCTSLIDIELPDGITNIGNGAFKSCTSLVDIEIPRNVVNIGEQAFMWCRNLNSIELPETLENIEDMAFVSCTSLINIELPKMLKDIGSSAFSNCENLIYIKIPENVKTIRDSSFNNCINLKQIEIPDGVENIEFGAFLGCKSLTSIKLPESIVSIEGEVFGACTNLINIEISENNENYCSIDGVLFSENQEELVSYPNGKKNEEYQVTEKTKRIMEFAFSGSENLMRIELPESIENIGRYAFDNCKNLTSIKFPGSVTKIEEGTFYNCIGLRSVIIPDSIVEIEPRAFLWCSNFTIYAVENSVAYMYAIENSIPVENLEQHQHYYETDWKSSVSIHWKECACGERVEEIAHTFIWIIDQEATITEEGFKHQECTECNYVHNENTTIPKLENITGENPETEIVDSGSCGEDATYTLDSEGTLIISGTGSVEKSEFDKKLIKEVIVNDGITSIGDYAFGWCRSLTSITMSESVNSIGEGAFSMCSSLKNINIPKSVQSIEDYAFADCDSITSISIPEGVTSIGKSVFSGCEVLESINIPASVEQMGESIFFQCNNLTKIEVASENERYSFEEGVLFDKEKSELMKCLVSKSGEYCVPEGIKSIGVAAFSDCSNLTSINIPSSVNSINGFAFSGCNNLVSINIPEGVTSIGELTFGECKNLKSITIPKSMSNIGPTVFAGCSSLTSVIIPEGVTSIGEGAFSRCTNLQSISIPSSVTNIDNYAFGGCSSLTIYCIENSTAHTYAVENSIPYVLIEMPVQESITITFNANGGTNLSQLTKTITVENAMGELPTVTREGYTFKGWYTQATGGIQVTAETIMTEDMTLYAQWEQIKQEDITPKPPIEEGNKPQPPENNQNNNKPQTPGNTEQQNKPQTPQIQSITNAVIKLSKISYNYNGKAQKPSVESVQLAGKTLTAGTDYTISYKNNKNIGTATVIVTGKGNYTGTATVTFEIVAKKGSSFTVGANKYKITGNDTISFAGVKNSKSKKVTIPKTVKIGGKNFKVTALVDNALKNNKKVTSVTIGENVTTIGKNVFYGCKQLGSITMKSVKMKKVGKNVFKGIKSNAKIKVPAKKLSAYKKLLKGKGQGKKVKITK